MQHLHQNLRDRLMDHHRSLGEDDPHRRLTAEIMQHYEALLNARRLLHLARDNEWRIHWPVKKLSSVKTKSRVELRPAHEHSSAPPPFDRLENTNPKSAEEALALVEDILKEAASRYMPDFHFCHDQWCAERITMARGNSNRMFRSIVRPPRSTRRGVSAVVIIVLVAAAIGLLTLPFLPRDILQTGLIDRWVTPAVAAEHAFNAEEKELLQKWLETAASGRRIETELAALAHRHADLLKAIALKLIEQAKQWQQDNNLDEAERRLALAEEMAKHLDGDENLSNHLARLRRALEPGFISER
jgi:hypothetical protein